MSSPCARIEKMSRAGPHLIRRKQMPLPMIRYAAGNPNRTTLCYAVKEKKLCWSLLPSAPPKRCKNWRECRRNVVQSQCIVFLTFRPRSPPSPHLVHHPPHPLRPPPYRGLLRNCRLPQSRPHLRSQPRNRRRPGSWPEVPLGEWLA